MESPAALAPCFFVVPTAVTLFRQSLATPVGNAALNFFLGLEGKEDRWTSCEHDRDLHFQIRFITAQEPLVTQQLLLCLLDRCSTSALLAGLKAGKQDTAMYSILTYL
jgi:hypothetical protein